MKKSFFILASFFIFQLSAYSQMEIKVHFNDATYDSIHIQKYNDGFNPVLSLKGATDVVFKQKKSLEPGLYFLVGDEKTLGSFILSSHKDQTFTIEVSSDNLSFANSHDNDLYNNYIQQIKNYGSQLDSLQQEYAQASQSMPQYMLAPLVENLTKQAEEISLHKREFQLQTGSELTGSLTATIALATLEIPTPPKEIQNQASEYQPYLLEHFFDNFPWNDPRVFNTPYADIRIKEFASFLVKSKKTEYGTYVLKALQAAKVDTASYFHLFDQLEKVLGDHASPVRIEPIYIQMLKDMQTLPKLPEFRARHCKYELSKIDINHAGDIAPNFTIVTNFGDTTTLHDIQSDYMLLYLQHPTCPTCQKIRKMIADYPTLNNAIASGKLKVLMVYFEDESEVWNNYIHSSEANPSYMHGWNFDQSIENKNLYDTRAIPYMFLLDKDKRIIKKNVMETELENEIRKLHIAN